MIKGCADSRIGVLSFLLKELFYLLKRTVLFLYLLERYLPLCFPSFTSEPFNDKTQGQFFGVGVLECLSFETIPYFI